MTFSRAERYGLLLLLPIFAWFTWRGLTMFYSGDDMMNMYAAWTLNPWRLAKAQLFVWMPVYRPVGGGIYRIFYALFGFHPEPLYVLCWLMLAANAILAYRWFRVISATAATALTALSLILVHGTFQDLYLSAGTIYDRLWFLFTVLGLTAYARRDWKFRLSVPAQLGICLLCILSMGSKESGIALPVLLVCYELIFHFPEVRAHKAVRAWLRAVMPLFLTLAAISLIFVAGRVRRTPELAMTAAYRPHASLSLWFTRVAEYFSLLTYHHVAFTMWSCAAALVLMALAALLLRNRPMIFGLVFFAVTITPVALISSRPGYVLYVPDLGLGLFFATAIVSLSRLVPRGNIAAFALVTLGVTWFHYRNWPAPFDTSYSPERRLTEQFRRDYPALPANTKLLFVKDEFPKPAYDLLFNLRLLYKDNSIVVQRLDAPPDQQPDPGHPTPYDHVFITEAGRYLELDNRDFAESIRLHILRDYGVGREMDAQRRDSAAYVISGVGDGEIGNPTRWTSPRAKLKFDLCPGPALFTAKFWLPGFVAKPAGRTLSILINGKEVGEHPMTQEGMNEIRFPVAANLITPHGFTIVEMNVANPYKDPAGQEFGVVLLRAGFSYADGT
ncbi:MAG: hypothetical protein ABUS49_05785 [Acidobacteriota bacterium]